MQHRTLSESVKTCEKWADRPIVTVNPDIANTLRDINERLGDDFESVIADFEYTPTARSTEPQPAETSGLRPLRPAMVSRIVVGIAFGVWSVATAGPTVLGWLGSSDRPPLAEPVGEPTQRVVVDGDSVYLEGMVPDPQISAVLESTAVAVVGRERVVNNFVISNRAVYDPSQPIQFSAAEPVLFTTGAARLSDQYRPLIDLAVELMEAEPTSTLSITGHTDDIGPAGANLWLSISRAEAVSTRIEQHGIERSRVTVDGRGETEPIDTNDTPEGRAVNRRVEFSIFGLFGL